MNPKIIDLRRQEELSSMLRQPLGARSGVNRYLAMEVIRELSGTTLVLHYANSTIERQTVVPLGKGAIFADGALHVHPQRMPSR